MELLVLALELLLASLALVNSLEHRRVAQNLLLWPIIISQKSKSGISERCYCRCYTVARDRQQIAIVRIGIRICFT